MRCRLLVLAVVFAASPALADGRKPTRLAQRLGATAPVRDASTDSIQRTAPPPSTPTPSRGPGLTLPADAISVAITTEAGVSAGSRFDIISVAPDLAVGITRDFTMAVIHSSSALTGFRGSAGAGICVTDACHARYADVGLEGLYNLARGDFAAALDVAIIASSLEPAVRKDLKLGFKIKVGRGRLYALTTPNVWLALDDRNDPMAVHEHQLWVPFSAWVKASAVAFGIGTGVKGPLDHFGTRWSVPLGGALQVTVNKHVTLGTSFVFGKFVGGDSVMDPGTNARSAQLWVALTSG